MDTSFYILDIVNKGTANIGVHIPFFFFNLTLQYCIGFAIQKPIIQSEESQKEKHQYSIQMHIHGIKKDGNNNPVSQTAKETQMYRTVFWTLWGEG